MFQRDTLKLGECEGVRSREAGLRGGDAGFTGPAFCAGLRAARTVHCFTTENQESRKQEKVAQDVHEEESFVL